MNTARLQAMANQIARNLAATGDSAAAAQTAQHITRYWSPEMRAALIAADPAPLDPIARQAVETLRGAIRQA